MELKNLLENASLSFSFAKELFKHNLVVFQSGEGALQILPPLVDVIPEARLNLVIYYLKQGFFIKIENINVELIKKYLKFLR
jgi:intraflagellar transport protein 56